MKDQPAFRKDCCCQHSGVFLPVGATFQKQLSGYQEADQVGSQSSEELALVCLQVLADRRNVQDNYYPTQERPAQPSHIWKEAATQRRARDLLLRLLSQPRGRLNASSHPFCERAQALLNSIVQSKGHSMQRKTLSSSPDRMAFLKISPLFFLPQMKMKSEILQEIDREQCTRTQLLPQRSSEALTHLFKKGIQTQPIVSSANARNFPHSVPCFLKVSLGSRIWDSSAFLPTSHERAAPAHMVPWRHFCKPHQRQRLETAKLPASTPPKRPKRRAKSRRDSSGGCRQRRSRGAWFPARRSARDPHLHWGSPDVRAAPGAQRSARSGRVSPSRPRSVLETPRAAAHLPALLSPPSGARGSSTATLLSRLLTARDVGTRLCASPATRFSAAPFPAVAFLFVLLSAGVPAQHVSRAARLPGALGSQRPPHPPAQGRSSPPPPLVARPRFDPHLQLCPGPPSSRPSVLPSCLPPLAVSPALGSSLPSCPRPPPLRGLGRPLPMRLG